MIPTRAPIFASIIWLAAACSGSAVDTADVGDGADVANHHAADAADAAQGDVGETPFGNAQVVFDYGEWTIPGGGEQYPCAQWTLNNDAPLYVNAVVQSNDGGFHHSNWYAVPEEMFVGEDGYFTCSSRGFTETVGALRGDVVFAQSTQAYVERQQLTEGVVIKIPPRSKIIGGLHLLNVSTQPLTTNVRMGLELVHPTDVEVVATPWRLDNAFLAIPGNGAHTRWEASCPLAAGYEARTSEEFTPLLYWVLPHYHALGDYFRVDVMRPEGDDTIVELAGFNAEANGITFDPPVDLTGATGLRMVCGYTNPYDRYVTWGLEGDDEMCTLLAFTKSATRINASVSAEASVDQSEGVETHHGTCGAVFIPKNAGQSMPTEEELAAPLYVPPSNDDGGGPVLVPTCEDTPADAVATGATTLASLRADVFAGSCAFSACHDVDAPAAGLDLTRGDLHSALLNHDVTAAVSMPLVTPGDPTQSWLYRVLSECEPATSTGIAAPMPRNSPVLLPAGQVARVRDWIAAGAQDD